MRTLSLLTLSLALSACSSPAPPADASTDSALDGAITRDALAPDAMTRGPVISPTHPRIELNATRKAALRALVQSSNPAAMRFLGMVNNQLGGADVYNYQAWFSALAFQLTGEARYADDAIQRVDAWVTAEEARIAQGMTAEVAGDSYLYVGEHVGNLALTLDWCFDRVSESQRTRWIAYANQAVWNVWHPTEARWGTRTVPWSGWSIGNPSNNYYYSFLRATVLLGLASYTESPQAPGWVQMFRETKIRDELVPAFQRDLAGGGSREGTGYGVAMAGLFRLYDQWQQSTGENIADLTPHAKQSLAFMLHEMLPTRDRIAPIGDHARDSAAELFDYHRDYIQILASLYADDPLAPRARFQLENSSVPRMSQGFMFYSDLLYQDPARPTHAPSDLTTTYYAPGTGNVFMRASWEPGATWAHVIAGPYTESHAHQDQGSFLLFHNQWLAYDQNILSHSGLSQSVTAHNLVRFAENNTPVEQRVEAPMSSRVLAMQDEPDYTYVAVDVTPAYEGRTAVRAITRELVFVKPDVLVVFDRAQASSSSVHRVWQLNAPVRPSVNGRVASFTNSGESLTVHALAPASSTLSVLDWQATDTDMNGGFRLDADDATGDRSLFLHVLVVGNAARNVTAADQSGSHGARFTLADGRAVTLRFQDSAPGATLTLTRADNTTQFDGPLPMGIEALPVVVY